VPGNRRSAGVNQLCGLESVLGGGVRVLPLGLETGQRRERRRVFLVELVGVLERLLGEVVVVLIVHVRDAEQHPAEHPLWLLGRDRARDRTGLDQALHLDQLLRLLVAGPYRRVVGRIVGRARRRHQHAGDRRRDDDVERDEQ